MKKVIVLLMICGILLVSGCNKNNEVNASVTSGATKNNDEIIVTCSSWNGWSSDYKPIEEEFVYPAQEGMVIKPDNTSIVGDFEFEIIAATSKSITIKTNQCMSYKEFGESGINLNSKEDTFKINKGEKIQLTTLTTDCGDIYIIEYK